MLVNFMTGVVFQAHSKEFVLILTLPLMESLLFLHTHF